MAVVRSDAELVAAARAGDQEAFGELVARYRDAVFGVAFHRLGNFEAARDAVQETFIKAFRDLGALRDADHFGHWLYRIADHTALNLRRREREAISLDNIENQPAAAPPPPAEDALAGRITAALATLSEPTRLAVILHYVNGYTHAEVAQFLGTSEGAVKTRVSRARSRLREEVLGMVQETLQQSKHGFMWIIRHPEGKAEAALGVSFNWPPEQGQQEVRKLATATYWLNPALKNEPGFGEQHAAAVQTWLQELLSRIAQDTNPKLSLEKLAHDPVDSQPTVRIHTHHGFPLSGWRLPIYTWQPLYKAFADLAGVALPLAEEVVKTTLPYQDGVVARRFKIEFHTERLSIWGEEITESLLNAGPGKFEYFYRDQNGRGDSAMMEAASGREVLEKIQQSGWEVIGIRLIQAEKAAEQLPPPLINLMNVVFGTALVDNARNIRCNVAIYNDVIEKPDPARNSEKCVVFSYEIAGTWHRIMTLPEYLWQPVCEEIISRCDDTLQKTETGRAGRISFGAWGQDFSAPITITDTEINIADLPSPPTSVLSPV
jgi:RNA polymerase sigma factor (sigma-70 family)